jgi:hypothetical protein
MGIPLGYRPSLDAASQPDAYPDQPYSPTEPLPSSRKRTFSQFDGRNPFAQSPQSGRNKIASLSGYSINQAPQGERASFALAPDQQLTDISPTAGTTSVDLTKPFWAQTTDVEHLIAQESQMAATSVDGLWSADSLFNAYVSKILQFYKKLMVLQLREPSPRRYVSLAKILRNCSRPLQQMLKGACLCIHTRLDSGLWLETSRWGLRFRNGS